MGIGELNQSDLHEQLKHLYAGEAGEEEVEIEGYVVDVVLPSEIVEIQTRSLGKLGAKLKKLTKNHRVRLLHPVAALTHIVKLHPDGTVISSRKSPKRGSVESAFREISSIAPLLRRRNLILEIALVEVTEFRRDDGRGSWRRRGVSIAGRKLERILERHEFRSPRSFGRLLPEGLPPEFTNRDLCELSGLRYSLVQPVTSTLRKLGVLTIADKRGRELVYRRNAGRSAASSRVP